MDISALQYGNPTIDQLQNYLNATTYLDVLLPEFTSDQYAFPGNETSTTKAELNDLKGKASIAQTDQELIKRYKAYDRSLTNVYNQVTFDAEEDTKQYQQTIVNVLSDVLPLIFKVKIHFQRPRPYQLAGALKLKLFPFYSYSADSPAYPSLHACVGKVLAGVLITHYPTEVKYFTDLGNDMGFSRLYMGLNYQSSMDGAIRMGDRILKNREFQTKYKL